MSQRSKKDEILDSAIELAREKGYMRLTYLEVAERARVPRTLIYYYFPSSIPLTHHILDEARKRGEAEILAQAIITKDNWTRHLTEREICLALNSSLESTEKHR